MQSDLPLDVGVLTGAYVWVLLWQADHHLTPVYALCLLMVGCSLWMERQLTRASQGKSTQPNIVRYLRTSKNSGTWYAVLPMMTVAVNAVSPADQHEGWVPKETGVMCLLLLGTFLPVIPWLTGDQGGGHTDGRTGGLTATGSTILLVFSIADLGFLSNTICAQGFSMCLVGVAVQLICAASLYLCVVWGRGVFSLGEAMVLAQLYTLFIYRLGSAAIRNIGVFPYHANLEEQVNCFTAVAFLGVTVVVLLLLLYCRVLSRRPGPLCFYSLLTAVALGMVVPALSYSLPTNPVFWLILYLVTDPSRLILFVSWVVLTLLAVVTVLCLSDQPSTATRKYFHGLVVAVYGPGLLLDKTFLSLAAVIALGVLIVLEAVRVLNIPPLGGSVHLLFKAFCDEKDKGPIIVSHIYLLLGLSLPVWLSLSSKHALNQDISLFSGVISLGIGDTAASVGGTMFGRHRWPGSKKTIEGTVIAVFCQLASIIVLYYLGMGMSQSAWTVLAVVVMTSVLEGVTAQIDNLILPLFMFSLFSATTTTTLQTNLTNTSL